MQRDPADHYSGVSPATKGLRKAWTRLPVRFRTWLFRLAAAGFLAASPFAAYLLTAVFLGSILVHSDRREIAAGIPIYVDARSFHTDLFLPRSTTTMDFRPWFRAEHFMRFNRYGDYVSLGWGDRTFFTEVMYWFDMTPGIALRSSLLPTPTLMHVSIWHSRGLDREPIHRLRLSEDEYRRLWEHVRSGFQLGHDGLPMHVPHLTHRGWDAFFEGAGSYTGINTCNQWAGEALRRAGVPMGLWTPFAFQVREALDWGHANSGKAESELFIDKR